MISEKQDPDGFLVIDKPSGISSHDVVYSIRRNFKFSKVGHGGTLDPAATGLLVILIGKCTKFSDEIMGGDKIYTGTFQLGKTTTSQDRDGEVVSERDFSHITDEDIHAAMKKQTGDIYQIPPMVSAIKVNGVPLYKLARQGEEIERKPRFIHVYKFTAEKIDLPNVAFRVLCTKGTYVRTLAHDVGEALNCGAFLTSLRREASGLLNLSNAITLKDALELSREELTTRIISIQAYRNLKNENL